MFIEGEANGVGEMVEPVFTLAGEDPGTILAEARKILYACTSSLSGLVLGNDWIYDIKNAVRNLGQPVFFVQRRSIKRKEVT